MAKACTGQRPPGLSSYLSLEPECKAVKQIAVPCCLALPCLQAWRRPAAVCGGRGRFPSQLNGLKTEDTKLRACSALGVGKLSQQVTELTHNFIYKSHPPPLSANLCAFFVKCFRVFEMPVDYLEFSTHFYTDMCLILTQTFFF